jgi:hypothetical protein
VIKTRGVGHNELPAVEGAGLAAEEAATS